MAVPHDTITALALIEDIVNARFRWVHRLRDCTVVWAHHDDSSNRESKGIRSPPPGAHSHCVQRCASQHLALNRTTFFKVLQLELVVTFCHSTCFILLLKLKLSAGFDKSDKRNMCFLFFFMYTDFYTWINAKIYTFSNAKLWIFWPYLPSSPL